MRPLWRDGREVGTRRGLLCIGAAVLVAGVPGPRVRVVLPPRAMLVVVERLGGPVVVMVVTVVVVMVRSVGRVGRIHRLEVSAGDLAYLNAESAA